MKSRSLHDDFVLSHRATKRTLNLLRAYSSIWEEERDSVGVESPFGEEQSFYR